MSKNKQNRPSPISAPVPDGAEPGDKPELGSRAMSSLTHGDSRMAVAFQAPPEGFVEILTDKFPRCYFIREPGNTVVGVLMEKIAKPEGGIKGHTFTLRLTQRCPDMAVKDGELTDGEVGDLVGVDATTILEQALEPKLQDPPGTWELFIQCTEKIELANGINTMWRYKVFSKKTLEARMRDEENRTTNVRHILPQQPAQGSGMVEGVRTGVPSLTS
jgi:hypothetical protein